MNARRLLGRVWLFAGLTAGCSSAAVEPAPPALSVALPPEIASDGSSPSRCRLAAFAVLACVILAELAGRVAPSLNGRHKGGGHRNPAH